jgi:hypothetical protein
MMMVSFFFRERTSIAAPLWCLLNPARSIKCCKLKMDPNEVGMRIAVRHADTIELYMLKGEGQGEWRIFIGRGILKPKEFKQDRH